MKIKVLGPGCVNCKTLYERTNEALKQLNVKAEIEYVTDWKEITKYINLTPGLIVNEKIVHQGKPLPSVDKIKEPIKPIAQ